MKHENSAHNSWDAAREWDRSSGDAACCGAEEACASGVRGVDGKERSSKVRTGFAKSYTEPGKF